MKFRNLLLAGSIATGSAVLLIIWTYVVRIARGRAPGDGLSPIYWELPGAYLWILLFPLIYYVVRRNPLTFRSSVTKLILIHSGFALLFSAFHMVFNIVLSGFLYNAAGVSIHISNPWCPWLSSLRISWRILLYFLLVTVCYALEFYHGIRAARSENSLLENRLKRSRLEQLRIQINPAFVQRTLSDVYHLMHTNMTAAIETITRLGAFFRLIQKQETEVTLGQRIQVLRSYFRVESERSEGSIRAQIKIDPALLKKRVPEFHLQPVLDHFLQLRIQSGISYRLRVKIKKGKGGIKIFLKDNLCWPEDQNQLIAAFKEKIGSAYLVTRHRNGIQILFRTQASTAKVKPEIGASGVRLRFVTWCGVSLLMGLFLFARQMVLLVTARGNFMWEEVTKINTGWLLYGVATPLILWLAKKVKLQGAKSILYHFFFALSLTVLFITFHALFLSQGNAQYSWKYILNSSRASSFPDQILLYWAIVLLANAFSGYGKYFREQTRTAQLQSDLSHAQLRALEMQLHPHFLFNTLHAINGLILTDKAVAATMLTRLQYFLQMTLRSSEQHLVPLKQELRFLDCYLDIQKIRFGDRLNVRMMIDPEALDLPVPQLILQPIVENAIRHGVAQQTAGGEIVLRVIRQNGSLRIAVQDNGPGVQMPSKPSRKGVGLQNSALRLHHLYGESQKFLYGNRYGGGFEVKMEIPVTA